MTVKNSFAQQNENRPQPTLMKTVPLAMLLSGIANLAIYRLAGVIYPEVTAWAGASAGQVVGASVVYLLIGTAVFALIRRLSAKPARHFTIIATVGLLLSLWMPISAMLGYAPGQPATPITAVTLSLMHLIAYLITLPLFNRTL